MRSIRFEAGAFTSAALCALLASACGASQAPGVVAHGPTPAPIDTMSLRTDTRVLAHDSLGGRGTGSAGARSAARYIARRLQEIGLRPLSGSPSKPSAYLDPVPLLRADVSAATLAVSGSATHTHGDGFIVGRIGREGLRALDAPVAALGADSTNVVRGAWLVLSASLGEAAERWLPRWRDAGVAGLIVRLPSDAAVRGYHAQLGHTRWQLREGPPDAIWQGDLPLVMVGPTVAAELERTGARLAFDPHARVDTVTDHNVVGVLGDLRAAEPVVLTAHYDHLGTIRGAGVSDSIFNGFSDNAAGVSMLLAIAQTASASPPERPLVFLFAGAEEVGLLGSIHFVRAHRELVERTHALVNLDAGAPPAAPTRWRLAAGTRSWAGAVAETVVARHDWAHRADPGSPNSDHWPFVARGVPAVFLIPDGGYENVDDEGARRLTERWDRYHQPGDEWAPDFPFAGLARYAALGLEIAYALASTDAP